MSLYEKEACKNPECRHPRYGHRNPYGQGSCERCPCEKFKERKAG